MEKQTDRRPSIVGQGVEPNIACENECFKGNTNETQAAKIDANVEAKKYSFLVIDVQNEPTIGMSVEDSKHTDITCNPHRDSKSKYQELVQIPEPMIAQNVPDSASMGMKINSTISNSHHFPPSTTTKHERPVVPGAVHVEGPHIFTRRRIWTNDEEPTVVTGTSHTTNSRVENRSSEISLVAHVVHEELDLVEATLDNKDEHPASRCRVIVLLCVIISFVILISVLAGTANKRKEPTNKTPVEHSVPIISLQLRQTPRICSLENEVPICLGSLKAFTSAIFNNTKDIVLCPGTTLQIPSELQPLQLKGDNFTFCCAGYQCALLSTSIEKPLLRITGTSVFLQRIQFQGLISDSTNDSSNVEGGGLVIIEGGGTHYIDSCVFEGGRATQTYNFQKFGGNLFLDGSTKGNARIYNSSFVYGDALKAGGGAYIQNSNICEIESCEFKFNQANVGGGLGLEEISNISLISNYFEENTAYSQGEAIWLGSFGNLDFLNNSLITSENNLENLTASGSCEVYVSENKTCVPLTGL